MFATSLSLIAGYGIKACLITQDMKQIYAAYGSNETITSNCDTRVAFRPNGIETARLLSQMTGEATVRHLHQTVSSSGASVSEPEFARLLLTPDEAMRLGASEALIFASGRPVIRAAKFRYYRERLFKRLAMIPPPLVSDHIEHKSEIAEGVQQQKNQTTSQTLEEMEPSQQPDFQFVTVKPRRHKPAPAEQLSFLKFAVKNGKDAVEAPKEEGAKERLL
jgi:type IV secretory pathway TraG/TraD family ATPase VirD4